MAVTHLVFWQLADPAATSGTLTAKLQELKSGFPSILHFQANTIDSPDTGFNFALHSEFKDWTALKEYMQAPEHLKLITYINGIIISKKVIDYEGCAWQSSPTGNLNRAKGVIINSAANAVVSEQPWGRLVWHASQAIGNSAAMTIGPCEINPGIENPHHFHPNCEEILVVLSGKIIHSIEGRPDIVMMPGDCITIPAGVAHNARNNGTDRADLSIAFSSEDRKTVPVNPASKGLCR